MSPLRTPRIRGASSMERYITTMTPPPAGLCMSGMHVDNKSVANHQEFFSETSGIFSYFFNSVSGNKTRFQGENTWKFENLVILVIAYFYPLKISVSRG